MKLLPRSRWLRGLLIVPLSAIAALIGAELYLRCFRPVSYRAPLSKPQDIAWSSLVHRRSNVPGLSYELAPNVVRDVRDMHIETNSLGMRCHEPAAVKDAGLVRIAVLGDSVTFGFSVPVEDTYCSVLERELNAAEPPGGKHFEVLNFGVGGYSTRDEAVVLEAKALPLQPDLVIVGYFLNDPDFEPSQPLHRYFRGTEWWEHSHLLRLMAKRRFDLEKERFGGGDLYAYYHFEGEARWNSVLTAFDRMRAAAEAAHVRILLVVFPVYLGFPSFELYLHGFLHDKVVAAASERGFATLDLLAAFRASGAKPEEVRADPEHPNARGHAIAARAILEKLVKERATLLPRW